MKYRYHDKQRSFLIQTVSKGRTNNESEEGRYSCNALKMIQFISINTDQISHFNDNHAGIVVTKLLHI